MEKIEKIKYFFVEHKTTLLIILLIIVSIISIAYSNVKDKTTITINNEELVTNLTEGKIAVYITGEVENPGVYYIDEDSRLNDLIQECGGLTSSADVSDLNLAEKLNDADKIDIPKKTTNTSDSEEEIYEEDDEEYYEDEEDVSSSELININTATKQELKTLNGIGDSLADRIIEYRNTTKFETIEDIQNVSGIGQAKYENIKEYICVN